MTGAEFLTPSERELLLRLSRASIEEAIRGDGSLERVLRGLDPTPALGAPCGAFVTVKVRTATGALALRGCLGNTSPSLPLHRTVPDLARRAAQSDPRFEPVREDELGLLHVAISVLGPMTPLSRPGDIAIGAHGVQLRKGAATAVFLPEVAVEQRWTVEQLLGQLARKAGLSPTDWRDAELSVFRTDHFAEPVPASRDVPKKP